MFALFLAGAPISMANPAEFIGSAVSVSGKVLVRSESSQTNQMVFLKTGDKIQVGSIINTSSTGAVKLLMTDKTIVDLGPSSLFKVNEYKLNQGSDREIDVSIDYGKVRASVNQHVTSDKGKFTIRTKAATMGVRGTEFVINAPFASKNGEPAASEQTQLTVIKGRVDVVSPNSPNAAPTSVTAGMQFFKPAEGLAQITKLDPQQIQQVKQEAFQKDMTFTQTVSMDTTTSSKGETSGSQTLKAVAANVEAQTLAAATNPPISQMQFPGVFGPAGTQPPAPQILQGQPVQLNVRFTP